jgi:hypothetical protein
MKSLLDSTFSPSLTRLQETITTMPWIRISDVIEMAGVGPASWRVVNIKLLAGLDSAIISSVRKPSIRSASRTETFSNPA